MNATTTAYLLAALAFAVPAQQATKYILQFCKGLLPTPAADPGKSNMTRIYAVLMGAIALPAMTAAWSYAGTGPSFNLHELPFDVVVGAASGLAAVADYHLLSVLQGMTSGSPPALTGYSSTQMPPVGVVVPPITYTDSPPVPPPAT